MWADPNQRYLGSLEGADEYVRDADPTELIATLIEQGHIDWSPQLRVVVYFGINGQVTDGFLQTPEQQALIGGKHVDHAIRVSGGGRKQQVLSWLY